MTETTTILFKIYQAQEKVSVFDLLYEFGLPYAELKPILEDCVEKKLLSTEDGKFYTFIGDGEMFSEQNGTGAESSEGKAEPEKEGQTAGGEEAEKSGRSADEENEEFFRRRNEDIEARRLVLRRLMQERENKEDDEDDRYAFEDVGDKIVEDEDDEEDDADLSGEIFGSMSDGFEIEQEEDGYAVSVTGLEFCETDAKFLLGSQGGKVYLSDRGVTLARLKEAGISDGVINGLIANILSECEAERIEEEIRVEIPSAERTLACFLRLFLATGRIYRIGELLPNRENRTGEVPDEFIKVLEYVVEEQKVSIIEIYAEFGISPSLIGLMLRWMEEEGFITPLISLKESRRVLLTKEEFKRRFGKD